jgi:hypothetical protein
MKDTATLHSQMIAKAINAISGGTEFKPGKASPTPDQIDYLIGQATGGVGREAGKLAQSIGAMKSGEDLPPHKIPLAGRFYGDSKAQASQSGQFYENIKALAAHEQEIKGRSKTRGDVAGYIQENPEARLWQFANKTEREVSELNRKKREMKKQDAPRERIKAVEDQITARMTRFNDRVKEARERAPAQ